MLITLLISIPFKSFYSEGYIAKQPNLNNEFERRIDELNDKHKELILNSIIYIESRGDHNAYNQKENAVGILQIRPIMLKQANKIIGFEKFLLYDRWDKEKSIEIFWTIQDHFNPELSLEQACHIWNAGIFNKSRWEITENYRNKALIIYNNLSLK